MSRPLGKQAAARRLAAVAEYQCPSCFERVAEGQACGCRVEGAPAWVDGPVSVHLGKALSVLRTLPDESVDAVVTDPPAGISFMGASWDTFPTRERPAGHVFADGRARPGVAGGQEHDPRMRRPFIAFMTEIAVECLRVLKPGAHGLVWAIPRTSHWTATALEDAGFEVRDVVHHHFGSGFPKSKSMAEIGRPELGTALKPATEHWILVRRPIASANVAATVLAHGTGALNIDGCRVGIGAGGDREGEASADRRYTDQAGAFAMLPGPRGGDARGRWPANVAFSHGEGCVPMGTRRVQGAGWRDDDQSLRSRSMAYNAARDGSLVAAGSRHYADAGGMETVEAWECAEEGCPVAELDRQSGTKPNGSGIASSRSGGIGGGMFGDGRPDHIGGGYGDQGGASRFFYVAKASTRERSAGLPPGQRNEHPTVKPIELMRYLCRLVTPVGGLILDPFAGSGTTLVAAAMEGFRAIGIEQDEASVVTARYRVAWALGRPLVPDESEEEAEPARAAAAERVGQMSLLEAIT